MLEPDEKEEIKRRMDELAREYGRIPRGDPRREEIVNETSALCWRLDQLLNRTIPAGMDKVLKWVQFLTLILICLVCLAYIWRQYYDYKRRQEAWDICWKWGYDEAKTLSKSETLAVQECMERIKP
jgi:hypothetical protein